MTQQKRSLSDEQRAHLREKTSGRKLSPEHKARIGAALRGRPKSEAHKQALKEHHVGSTGRPMSQETKRKIGQKSASRKQTAEARLKMRNARLGRFTGPDHPNWKGGITPVNRKFRGSPEYRAWSAAVLRRDAYTCQHCGVRGKKLHAHHIKFAAQYPELRLELGNGLALCVACHSAVHGRPII